MIKFMEESEGNKSSIRLMSFVSLLAAMWFGFITIPLDKPDAGIYITMGFLLGAFAPKALQKFAEKK